MKNDNKLKLILNLEEKIKNLKKNFNNYKKFIILENQNIININITNRKNINNLNNNINKIINKLNIKNILKTVIKELEK